MRRSLNKLLAVLALSFAAVLVGSRSALTNAQGTIAFEQEGRIYVINPDGSGLRRLRMRPRVRFTCLGANECGKTIDWSDPAWAPNGKQLALLGYFDDGTLDGDTRVYIREPKGLTRVAFVSDVGVGGVSWSPDGKWLAHDSGRDLPALILIRVSTGKAHAVGESLLGQDADWSPDGENLAFDYAVETATSQFPDWQGIAIVARDGTNFRLLTRSGGYPDWSPDGHKIAFGVNGIRTVDLMGDVVRLTRTGGNPSWSPDGSRIVFERGKGLWIMNSTGSHQELLVQHGQAPDWSQ